MTLGLFRDFVYILSIREPDDYCSKMELSSVYSLVSIVTDLL